MNAAPPWIKPAEVAPDKLDALRVGAERLRDAELTVKNAENALKIAKADYNQIRSVVLPDLMNAAGVDRIGLPARGNLKASDAVMQPYFHASISAEWPPEKQATAFAYLEEKNAGDLIRVDLTVSFGKTEIVKARELAEAIAKDFGYPSDMKMSVHWKTLTSWVKETVKAQEPLDLEKIGATVGTIVEIKERKED